jgi:hypothetical protein
MKMKMAEIKKCDDSECAYNTNKICHAIAITVGDAAGECPLCDTAFKHNKKGGVPEETGGVGACKVESCAYNDSLECSADNIVVKMHTGHAECGTFKKM